MGFYILAGHNGIVRLSEGTEEKVVGLGAEKITLGIVLIISSDNKKSLIHLDNHTDFQSVLDEIAWVSDSYKIILVRNIQAIEYYQPLLKFNFETTVLEFLKMNGQANKLEKIIDASTAKVFINRSGDISVFTPINSCRMRSSDFELRYATNYINAIYHKSRPAVIEFDGKEHKAVAELFGLAEQVFLKLKKHATNFNCRMDETIIDAMNDIHIAFEKNETKMPEIPGSSVEHFIQQIRKILDHHLKHQKKSISFKV